MGLVFRKRVPVSRGAWLNLSRVGRVGVGA